MNNDNIVKKSSKLKIVFVIFVIIIVIITALFLKNKSNDNNEYKKSKVKEGIRYNTNKKVVEDKVVDNIKFTNIECTFDGNNSLLSYTITNIGNEKVNLGEYEIIVKDKNGNVLANLGPSLNFDLEPNQPYDTGNSINIDISEAYSIEIQLSE